MQEPAHKEGDLAEQEDIGSNSTRPPQEEAKVDHWIAEIEKWVLKIDRAMGEGSLAEGTNPSDKVAGLSDSAPGPRG